MSTNSCLICGRWADTGGKYCSDHIDKCECNTFNRLPHPKNRLICIECNGQIIPDSEAAP